LGRIEDIVVSDIESSKKMMLGVLNGDKIPLVTSQF